MTAFFFDGDDDDNGTSSNGQQPDPVIDAQNIGDDMGEKIGEGSDEETHQV